MMDPQAVVQATPVVGWGGFFVVLGARRGLNGAVGLLGWRERERGFA